MKRKYINDVWQRALKTFIQAFFGVLIPEAVTLLQSGIEPGQTWVAIVLPVLCASLAAGISAGWNVINNWLVSSQEGDDEK